MTPVQTPTQALLAITRHCAVACSVSTYAMKRFRPKIDIFIDTGCMNVAIVRQKALPLTG